PYETFPYETLPYETTAARTGAHQGRTPRSRPCGRRSGDQTHREVADQAGATMRSLRRVQLGDGGTRAGAACVHVQDLRQANETRLIRRSGRTANRDRVKPSIFSPLRLQFWTYRCIAANRRVAP